jgi:pimeloyl-ACP methyl ester carboxylesterase
LLSGLFFFALVVCAALLAAPFLYQAAGERSDARRFPPLGELVESGGVRLHLHRQGKGSPAVLFEAGIAGSLLGWALVQPQVAEFATTLSYDRAGLGWSDECATPRTVDCMLAELTSALKQAKIPGPYILVGHSFGGLLIRAFAHARPQDVAGMLFVDPVTLRGWAQPTANQLWRLQVGAKLSRRGALLARIGVVRAVLSILISGGKWLPKLVARASAGQGLSTLERLAGEVSRLPAEVRPMVRAHWSRPKTFQAMAAYLECLPGCARQTLEMPLPAGIPFVILSAGSATAGEIAERKAWVSASVFGRHQRLEGTGHWLQLETPEALVEAVRELVMRYRTSAAAAVKNSV